LKLIEEIFFWGGLIQGFKETVGCKF
jgi:hypothetical protein